MINIFGETNLWVLKLPHGSVDIKQGDRVAPNNRPDPNKDRPDASVKLLRYSEGLTILHMIAES